MAKYSPEMLLTLFKIKIISAFPLWHSGLMIQSCHSCGLSHSRSLDLISGPGTSIHHRCSRKRKKKKKIKIISFKFCNTKQWVNILWISECVFWFINIIHSNNNKTVRGTDFEGRRSNHRQGYFIYNCSRLFCYYHHYLVKDLNQIQNISSLPCLCSFLL